MERPPGMMEMVGVARAYHQLIIGFGFAYLLSLNLVLCSARTNRLLASVRADLGT